MICLGNKQIILSFLRLHPSTAFQILLLTMMVTPFLLRDSVLCWSSLEEIPHVQGQRNPSKRVRGWSGGEEIPHIQGQRRSPSKMVGGANSHLESNPIPTRDAQRAQINFVCTRTQVPLRD